MGLIKKIILYHIGWVVDGILLLILGGDGGERLYSPSGYSMVLNRIIHLVAIWITVKRA